MPSISYDAHVTTLGLAWRQARAARVRTPRVPLTIRAVAWAARRLPSWERARSAVMQTGGCVAIDVGLFQWRSVAGWIGIGVSLFVLEALSGEK